MENEGRNARNRGDNAGNLGGNVENGVVKLGIWVGMRGM